MQIETSCVIFLKMIVNLKHKEDLSMDEQYISGYGHIRNGILWSTIGKSVNFDPLGNKGADKLWTWSHCSLRIPSSPLDISKLVTVCHLFMATNQEFFWRRQLRSMTSCSLPIKLLNWWSLSIENSPEGNSHDVTMTWNYNIKVI